MVGPDKQFNQEEVLDRALELFWAKGFEATSMQDLVNNMGINRASMYHTYGNKHALFSAALERYIETNLASLKQALEGPGSQLDNLYNVFQSFIEQSLQGKSYGCFINNTAVELGPHDPEIAEKIRNFWHQFEHLLSSVLKRAIVNGELAENTDTEKLALLLNISLQGLVVKIKTNASREELESGAETLFELIRQNN